MTNSAFRSVLLGCALLVAALSQAFAQAPAPKIISAGGPPITLDVGKGEIIRLDHPVDSVFIADPDVADVQVKSPTLIYIFGKSSGDTTLYGVGAGDHVALSAFIHVHYDISGIQQAIQRMAPHAAVSVNSINDALVLDGTVYSAAQGDEIRRIAEHFVQNPKNLINRMKVDEPNQINLRVRVAEISRDIVKQFGINWDAVGNANNIAFGLASGAITQINTAGTAVVPTGGIFQTRRQAIDGKTTLNNIFSAFRLGALDLSTVIDALDSQGLITVLAEPNLTAVSGEPASFLAGGEFPVPVASSVQNGVQTISIEFKKFGVSLNFVGTIAADNRINLRVIPEVSELSNNGAVNINNIQIPALATRRADTTVELASGQSLAIAGLLSNDINQEIQKFPWLGDVPVLGQLFRSEAFRRQESELVIIVTPYVVRPVTTARRLLGPTDGFVNSSDGDMVFTGAEYKPQALNKATPPIARSGRTLIGPAGFDLD